MNNPEKQTTADGHASALAVAPGSAWAPPPEQPKSFRVCFCADKIEYCSELLTLNQAESARFDMEQRLDLCCWMTEEKTPNNKTCRADAANNSNDEQS